MYYRHNLDYVYPDRSDEHMIEVKHLRDTHFDENHRYYNKTFGYKILRFFLSVALYLVVWHVVTIRHGLKIYGRKEFNTSTSFYLFYR